MSKFYRGGMSCHEVFVKNKLVVVTVTFLHLAEILNIRHKCMPFNAINDGLLHKNVYTNQGTCITHKWTAKMDKLES